MTILWIAIGAVVWLACGALAVGVMRYDFAVDHDKPGRRLEVSWALLGVVGLLLALDASLSVNRLGLKWRYDK